jgi:hypothetical protein
VRQHFRSGQVVDRHRIASRPIARVSYVAARAPTAAAARRRRGRGAGAAWAVRVAYAGAIRPVTRHPACGPKPVPAVMNESGGTQHVDHPWEEKKKRRAAALSASRPTDIVVATLVSPEVSAQKLGEARRESSWVGLGRSLRQHLEETRRAAAALPVDPVLDRMRAKQEKNLKLRSGSTPAPEAAAAAAAEGGLSVKQGVLSPLVSSESEMNLVVRFPLDYTPLEPSAAAEPPASTETTGPYRDVQRFRDEEQRRKKQVEEQRAREDLEAKWLDNERHNFFATKIEAAWRGYIVRNPGTAERLSQPHSNSAGASEVIARPVTFFKVGVPTASFRPAIEELATSKAAVTEEAVLSKLGGAPPLNLVPEGAKVGVRMWNRWAWNPSLSAPSCTLPPPHTH